MPVTSAGDLVRLRTTRHATLLSLGVYAPQTIWTGQVNGAQTTGDTTITVDNVLQLFTPARHFQVLFGSTAGASDLGETRFKAYAAPTLTVAPHNIPLANDTYITIKRFIAPAGLPCTIDDNDVVTEDGDLSYTNQNTNYHPLARIGPPGVAFIDPTTGLATLNYWSNSVAIATGATLSSHSWTFPSGTPATSILAGTAVAPIVVTRDTPGSYYDYYTVVDSNGKTHTRYNPCFIFDRITGTTPYRSLEIESLSGDRGRGAWTLRITVKTTATPTEFPYGAQVVLFAEDWYGTEKVSIGGQWTHRENIVFVGYIKAGTVKKDWLTSSVSFEVEGLGSLAETINALGFSLETNVAPTGWHFLSAMTYNRAAFHILTEHSTFSQIADVNLNLPTYTKDYIDCMDGNLKDQLSQQVAAPDRGLFGSSAQGMLYLEANPQFLASRTNPVVLSSTFADFRDELDLGTEESTKEVCQVDFVGEDNAGEPFFSLAPPTPWAFGRQGVEQVDGIRVTDQTESNQVAGFYEGERNNSFRQVIFPFRGNYRIADIFPVEAFQMNMAANQNLRGVTWSNQKFYPVGVDYQYQPGILLASATMEKDIVGAVGITGDIPTDEPDLPGPTVIPTQPPIVEPTDPGCSGPACTPGKGNLLYISSLKGMAKCVDAYGTDGTDGVPVWTAINNGLAGDALKIRWFNLDPWSKVGDHFTAGWAMTDDGLYRVTGLPDTPVWAQQLSGAAAQTLVGSATVPKLCYRFTPSVITAGYIAVGIVPNEAGLNGRTMLYYAWSTDYGATWNVTTKPIGCADTPAQVQTDLVMVCSFTTSGRYFATGPIGARAGYTDAGAWNNNLYEWGYHIGILYLKDAGTGRLYGFATFEGISGPGATWFFPYCNGSTVPYANDNVGYSFGVDHTGVNALRRYTAEENPLWSPVGTFDFRPYTGVGDAAMPVLSWYFTNMWDEDYGVAIDAANIWCTANMGTAWTRYNAPTVGARTFSPTYHFMVPADGQILYLTGKSTAGGGVALVVKTINLGATLTDISNFGGAGDLDTVLGLVAGDMDASEIMVDYYKV